jgi:hypothetical protein
MRAMLGRLVIGLVTLTLGIGVAPVVIDLTPAELTAFMPDRRCAGSGTG